MHLLLLAPAWPGVPPLPGESVLSVTRITITISPIHLVQPHYRTSICNLTGITSGARQPPYCVTKSYNQTHYPTFRYQLSAINV